MMRFTKGEYSIDCYNGSELYSERKVIVIADEEDLEELSPDNLLPGIETLGDLVEVCGYGNYGLTAGELSTRIY